MPKQYMLPVWLLCATLLTSTAALAEPEKEPQPQEAPPAAMAAEAVAQPYGLTLEEAVGKALAGSPRLQAFGSGMAAARGELAQAGAWANPEIGVEMENVAGSGDYKGFDAAEMTYGVTQAFQIGGKLSAQEDIASRGLELARLDYQVAALDVVRDVTVAYAAAVAAEEKMRLATEQQELAQDVLRSVSVRVGAAAAPLIQKSRAEVELSTARIALDTAMRERDIAREALAALMGEAHVLPVLDSAAFYTIARPQESSEDDRLRSNPDRVKLHSGLEQSRARFELEKALAIPDPSVSVGLRDFRDSGDQALVLGVSLPIPVFNGNRGNIDKARHEVSRTEQENRDAVLQLNAALMRAGQQMESAYLRADTLKNEILPSADKAFRLAREGYGLGRFPYLEVLDAQRSLFDVKQQHIEAIREFHEAKAQVERLMATHLNLIQNTGESNAE